MENNFFKPTMLYKEYMILDMIEKNSNITQREMSKAIGIAVSMINSSLDEYEKKGLIKRKKHSSKTVEYFITKKGIERKKVLNIGYLNASQRLYNSAKENIEQFLKQIQDKGFKNILLYGAGEVAEILIHASNTSADLKLNAIAIVDDDPTKIGNEIIGTIIIPKGDIEHYDHDGILISSFTNKVDIKRKLLDMNYPVKKILEFFE